MMMDDGAIDESDDMALMTAQMMMAQMTAPSMILKMAQMMAQMMMAL
jgi:hypothetical protein